MIKVLEEKKVPRGTVRCTNCGSLLEYGNADLSRSYSCSSYITDAVYDRYTLLCPVCGCEVIAGWVYKTKEKV